MLLIRKASTGTGYTIYQDRTDFDVLTVKLKSTATKYLKYLVAGGLQWDMTEQPRNPEDKDLPEVKRYIALQDATGRWKWVLSDEELQALLNKELGT